MDADGSNQRRLTTTENLNETSPAWSPDGAVIAYQRGEVVDNAEGTGVFLIKADGSCSAPIAFDERLDVCTQTLPGTPEQRAQAQNVCAARRPLSPIDSAADEPRSTELSR